MRNSLRRIAAGLLASIAVTGALVVSSVAPASADFYGDWHYLRNEETGYCLATDWSTQVYSWGGCNDANQQWRAIQIYPNDPWYGTYVLQNKVTGRCLQQVDYEHVVTAPCSGVSVSFRWYGTPGDLYSGGWPFNLKSFNTGGWLSTDFNGTVLLYNGMNADNRQTWYWY
ncbi:hypothetical protein OHA72_57545 [Dactylosporangium sp. NBC_01737]|uniref:RICIN domain-containing protein n=1 Tax=Dactylosporangium sp. NBC_01737 TaxID=2975959 RepID=UPI002E13CE16|nr:hypothetical protein OHA72_57545 [Dactylosporangium sp. NBC_01737]